MVRADTRGRMATDIEKRRARWKRNKRASRARDKVGPKQLDSIFEQRVLAERDRRAACAENGAFLWPEVEYLFGDRLTRAASLAADVWMAIALYEAQCGPGTATNAHICRMLKSRGRMNGYTEGSLRKMVPKARERVKILETKGYGYMGKEVCWPAPNLSSDD